MLWLPQMKEADKSEGAGLDPVEVLLSHKTPNINPTKRYCIYFTCSNIKVES